jgi:hypothetical protein
VYRLSRAALLNWARKCGPSPFCNACASSLGSCETHDAKLCVSHETSILATQRWTVLGGSVVMSKKSSLMGNKCSEIQSFGGSCLRRKCSARTAGVGNLRKEHFEAQDQRQLQLQSPVAHIAVAPSLFLQELSHTSSPCRSLANAFLGDAPPFSRPSSAPLFHPPRPTPSSQGDGNPPRPLLPTPRSLPSLIKSAN